jgi:hypothetical protein|tara:strand:+ start:121 stop:282 length:162 start_codon:yes stop_codon:yes gene_type:complete
MRGKHMKRETWEIELDKNMESIRASTASIKKSYNAIMGLMIIVVAIELSGLFL